MASAAKLMPPPANAAATSSSRSGKAKIVGKTPSQSSNVPEQVRRLARFVAYAFYGSPHYIIMDILVRHPCVKEDDIREKLKLDAKDLQKILKVFKSDHFLLERTFAEPSGNSIKRKNYYAVNYLNLVNVIRLRVQMVRKDMEKAEQSASERSAFKCTRCHKQFADLDVDHCFMCSICMHATQLFDTITNTLKCSYCGSLVEEDHSGMPVEKQRARVAAFNRFIGPVQNLLGEIEQLGLSTSELQPDPFAALSQQLRSFQDNMVSPSGGVGLGGVAFGANQGHGGFLNSDNSNLVIVFDGDADANVKRSKPLPEWSIKSTITSFGAFNTFSPKSKTVGDKGLSNSAATATTTAPPNAEAGVATSSLADHFTITTGSGRRRPVEDENVKILHMLQEFESSRKHKTETHAAKGGSGSKLLPNGVGHSSSANGNASSFNNVDGINRFDGNAEEDGAIGVYENGMHTEEDVISGAEGVIGSSSVFVNGKSLPLSRINDDIVSKMTPEELVEYDRVTAEMYALYV